MLTSPDEPEIGVGAEKQHDVGFEQHLVDFEAAWIGGRAPWIGAYARGDGSLVAPDPELVAIDLGFRWRMPAGRGADELPARPRVDDYVALWPALAGALGLPVWLMGEEYRVRRLWGDRPARAELIARFPACAGELGPLLEQIDRDIAREQKTVRTQGSPRSVALAQGLDSRPVPAPADFRRLPGIEILETIGRGGMGVVYKARQVALNRLVAVKMVLAGRHATADEHARFRREAELAARIKHPNIAQIYEVGELSEQPYQVLEFVDGVTLQNVLERGRPAPQPAARLVEVLARAIAVAHQNGVVHRDLKPSNVLVPRAALLTERGHDWDGLAWESVKVVDFGLAKPVETTLYNAAIDQRATFTGALLGTPCYMAPEQAGGPRTAVGPAADVYALGAILYELLVGQPPFRGESLADTLDQVRTREPAAPRQLNASVPSDLETICLRCLRKDPGRRYATALALAEDLRRFRANEPILARPVSGRERLWLWGRRRPLVAGLATACALFALAAVVVGIYYSLSLARALDLAADRGQQAEQNFLDALETVRRSLVILGNERLAPVPEVEDARREALSAAVVMLERLGQRRATSDPALEHELARTYMGMGRISLFLGGYRQAEHSFREALAILERLRQRAPSDRALLRECADAELQIVSSLHDPATAVEERSLRSARAIEILERLAHDDPSLKAALAAANIVAGNITGSPHKRAHFTRAVELYEVLATTDPAAFQPRLARALFSLAEDNRQQGSIATASSLFERALAIWRAIPVERLDDTDRVAYAESLNTAGALLMEPSGPADSARRAEAVALVRQGLALREQMVVRQPRVYAYRDGLSRAYGVFALALARLGRYLEAQTALERAKTVREAIIRDFPELKDEPFFLAELLVNQASFEGATGNMAQAIATSKRAIELIEAEAQRRSGWGRGQLPLSQTPQNLAIQLTVDGRAEQALPWHDRSIAEADAAAKLPSDTSADREQGVLVHAARAQTYEALGRFSAAAADWKLADELCDSGERGLYTSLFARALAEAGDYQGTELVLEAAARGAVTPVVDYNLACAGSLAVSSIDRDTRLQGHQKQSLRARFVHAAIEHLQRARGAGLFADPAQLVNLDHDADLDALRSEPDFTALRRSLVSK
jgi:eukaryotic-like serine/threonine-protein kinase